MRTTGYADARRRPAAQLAALPEGAPVRLGKRTSNLFRTRADTGTPRLDVSAFSGVLSVDVPPAPPTSSA